MVMSWQYVRFAANLLMKRLEEERGLQSLYWKSCKSIKK
jgi:hypothetical protein